MKKLVSLISSLALITCAVPSAASADDSELSEYHAEIFAVIENNEADYDFNMNGEIDIFDSMELLNHYAELSTDMTIEDTSRPDIWEAIQKNGDLNQNGFIDACDSGILWIYCTKYKGTELPDPDIIQYEFENYRGGIFADSYVSDYYYSAYYNDKTAGDVDLDGKITSADASAVLSYYSEISTDGETDIITEKNMEYLADVNKDRRIDSSDASEILSIYTEYATQQ